MFYCAFIRTSAQIRRGNASELNSKRARDNEFCITTKGKSLIFSLLTESINSSPQDSRHNFLIVARLLSTLIQP